MPLLEARVSGREPVMAPEEKIIEHPGEVEINEARLRAQQEWMAVEHLLKWEQAARQFCEQALLFTPPFVEAADAELAFLVALIRQLLGGPEKFAVINIVELERHLLDFIFDAAPDDGLDAFRLRGKQAEMQFVFEVFGDDLGIIARFKDDFRTVLEHGNAVITLAGETPNERSVVRGNICDLKRRAGKFQNAPLHDAKRTPRKLNQFDHRINRRNRVEQNNQDLLYATRSKSNSGVVR